MLNLLASAIPGLRDLRAPLIAGYLWLLVAWLVIDPQVPLAMHAAPGVAQSVVGLTQTVGPAATAAGVSVIAYVLGALSVSLPTVGRAALLGTFPGGFGSIDFEDGPSTDTHFADAYEPRPVIRPGGFRGRLTRLLFGFRIGGLTLSFTGGVGWRKLVEELAELESPQPVSADAMQRAQEIREQLWSVTSDALRVGLVQPPALEEVRETLEEQWAKLSPRQLAAVVARSAMLGAEVQRELDLPNTLLVGDQPEIYAEADRARAEAEFRLALVLPALALIAVLVARGGPLWLIGALAPAALFATGLAKTQEARSFINNSIESGKTPSPAARRFAEYVNRRLGTETTPHA